MSSNKGNSSNMGPSSSSKQKAVNANGGLVLNQEKEKSGEEIDESCLDYGYGDEQQETVQAPSTRKTRIGRRASCGAMTPTENRRDELRRTNSGSLKQPRRRSLLPPSELDEVLESYKSIMEMDGDYADTGW